MDGIWTSLKFSPSCTMKDAEPSSYKAKERLLDLQNNGNEICFALSFAAKSFRVLPESSPVHIYPTFCSRLELDTSSRPLSRRGRQPAIPAESLYTEIRPHLESSQTSKQLLDFATTSFFLLRSIQISNVIQIFLKNTFHIIS